MNWRLPEGDALLELSRKENGQIDLAKGALLIARLRYPDLPIDPYLDQLDQMAQQLAMRLDPEEDLVEQLSTVNLYLFGEMGFRGNLDEYGDPRNSFLNDVLDRRLGIPITLSIVYLAVADRLGLPLCGISFPQHFLVQCTRPSGSFFIDPFHQGRFLSASDVNGLWPGTNPLPENALMPAPRKHVLARILRNLKGIYVRQKSFSEAVAVSRRIIWFQPDLAEEYRDLGFLYFQLRDYYRALVAFEQYLDHSDEPDDKNSIVQNIQVLAAKLGQMN